MRTGITVTYVYSACVVIETPDLRLLTDPWFTEGIYDGAWYHFPRVDAPLELIGDVDAIYISHIHPDHYDPEFLKAYQARYGAKKVVIADHSLNYLAGKMRADGISASVMTEDWVIGNTTISVIPHKTGSVSDIDSALLVRYQSDDRTHCVLNTNDIIADDAMIATLKAHLTGPTDILLCGYTGAGPYPQTYFDANDPSLAERAAHKKQQFFERYRALTAAIGARVNIPFAGQYLLGGRLVSLNDHRGIADAVEVLSFDSQAVVLADGGGQISTTHKTDDSDKTNSVANADNQPADVRTSRYPLVAIREREAEIAGQPMAYERLINLSEVHQLPLRRLLMAAIANAVKRSEVCQDYFFLLRWSDTDAILFNANRHATPSPIPLPENSADLPQPRSEITIDPRYLFGLLTHVYHWNNAEVGSQFTTRRYPDTFVREAQQFLNFLTV